MNVSSLIILEKLHQLHLTKKINHGQDPAQRCPPCLDEVKLRHMFSYPTSNKLLTISKTPV